MNFQPTADQKLFARTVRELLEKECPPEAARRGFSKERWEKLLEMGVLDMLGSGMTEIDMVPILEEAGRAALPEPLIEASIVPGEGLYGVVTAGVGTRYVAHADVADEIVLDHHGELYAVPQEATTLKRVETIDAPRPLFDVTWDHHSARQLDTDRDRGVARATLGAAAELLGLAAR